MKRVRATSIFLPWFVLVLVLTLPFIASCGDDDDGNPAAPATTGTITGTVALPAGVNGDLRNARIAVYTTHDDWANDRVLRSVAATGAENSVTFSIDNLTPGTYYLDVWKDMDNSTTINPGDLYGVHGTIQWPNITVAPLTVIAGQTASAVVVIIAIP